MTSDMKVIVLTKKNLEVNRGWKAIVTLVRNKESGYFWIRIEVPFVWSGKEAFDGFKEE